MSFYSILFETNEDQGKEIPEAPNFFIDLNLDQVVRAITSGKEEYDLKPFFYASLKDIKDIEYRHQIAKELENEALLAHITAFADKMHEMRRYLDQSERLYYQYQKERWFVDAMEMYCAALGCLANDLATVELKSRGMLAFREYVANYIESEGFTRLRQETKRLKGDLATVKYCLHIKDNCIKVRKYEAEADYSSQIEETFQRFQQGAVKNYLNRYSEGVHMNHVEAGILERVAQLYPGIFKSLDDFYVNHADYLDELIAGFDREIQFYVAYLTFTAKFKKRGLKFCYPQVSATSKEIGSYESFDLALADKLVTEKSNIICNDFYLKNPERIFVVSGPNQGGKTTFARTFGQLHYLASLGLPVPGREAQLFLPDRIFTHFEKVESMINLRGKLQDDLVRIRDILNQASSHSIIIMNEIFTSTTLMDAVFLSKKIIEQIVQMDNLCVWVTFIDELASFSEQTVSLISTVVPENPALRTYKIVRKPPDGLAYAQSIAEKYRLTYDCIKERVQS